MKKNLPPWMKDERLGPTVNLRLPTEFVKTVKIRAMIEDEPTSTAYLRKLAKKIRPTVEELKKAGLIQDDEDCHDFFK